MYCAQISDLISAIIIYLCSFVFFLKYAMNRAIDRREEKQRLAELERAADRAENGKGGEA